MRKLFIIIFITCLTQLFGELLIPMDMTQTNHLKAYGIAFKSVKEGQKVKWLLNYRGGALIMNDTQEFRNDCNIRGVSFEIISGSDIALINDEINANNMEVVTLEKEPKIAVYTPPNTNPWDDAVTLALTYAEIDYDKVWDEEVINGKLVDYDWLHLHHEDFTGQYGKFYASF
ncbi:MAG TPA: asparagine synthetase B, partial [Candidatus Cloacimonadota bacterium]|nr:asparagine synthetase B [Candidatus Cloacimonadota bacterium]